jgi:hypothetical protein
MKLYSKGIKYLTLLALWVLTVAGSVAVFIQILTRVVDYTWNTTSAGTVPQWTIPLMTTVIVAVWLLSQFSYSESTQYSEGTLTDYFPDALTEN